MYRGSWGEVHDNDGTLKRDSGICMEMTIEEDVPPQYFDYMQGQYHVQLENQSVSYPYPPTDNYYGGNDCWTTPESTLEAPYREASSPNEAYQRFLASKYQTHSPDVLNDNKEAMVDFAGNDIIIDSISPATAWPAQSPDNTTPLIVHSDSWNY